MQAFDYNNLFHKAKLYVQRALDEDRESDLFPFWLSLSLEFLLRSSLARISPALLADVSGNDGTNLLYSFGFETTSKPKSIQISEVLQRLTKIGIEFSQEEIKQATAIIDQRNTELHSGIKGFSEYPSSIWLGDYYRICNILLKGQGLSLVDFLGTEETKAAEQMITNEVANTKKQVFDKIQSYKRVFFELPLEQQQERKRTAETEIRNHFNKAKIVKCPVCESNALLSGELISFSDAKLVDSEIRQEKRYLPNQLGCFACGIRINGYPELKTIDFGGQFILEEYLDALDYHGIDPEEYVEIDYLVDKRLREIHEYEMYGDE